MKETNFFSEKGQWQKGFEYYQSLWEWDSAKHHIALEASPNYTNSLQEAQIVAQRTKTVAANFSFIYILRNPLQKIESMRKQGVYQGWYNKFLPKETPASLPLEVIESVKYADVIDTFVQTFSRERILLLKTEALKPRNEPAIAMKQICTFLDIDPDFAFSLEKIHNAQNTYRNDTLWHYLRSLESLSALKQLVPDTLKNKARSLLSKPLKKGTSVVPPLTKGQKDFILKTLKPDRDRLMTHYGLDTSSWDSDTAP